MFFSCSREVVWEKVRNGGREEVLKLRLECTITYRRPGALPPGRLGREAGQFKADVFLIEEGIVQSSGPGSPGVN